MFKMKKILLLISLIALMTLPSFAETTNRNNENINLYTNSNITSINITQKGNSKELSRNYETVKDNPLADKKWGIEINLIRLLFIHIGQDEFNYTFSGGVSLFNINRHVELAFPIFYYHIKNEVDNEYEESLRQFTLDCHYRRFLGKTQKGFYISGFIRYANIRGTKENGWYNGYEELNLSTENKIGIGFGFGYRIFSEMGLYWGVSLNIGIYLIGENYIFDEDPLPFVYPFDDSIIIFNCELLKFGWAF